MLPHMTNLLSTSNAHTEVTSAQAKQSADCARHDTEAAARLRQRHEERPDMWLLRAGHRTDFLGTGLFGANQASFTRAVALE